jgi:hypothetical protein
MELFSVHGIPFATIHVLGCRIQFRYREDGAARRNQLPMKSVFRGRAAFQIGRYVSISKGPWNAGSRPAAPEMKNGASGRQPRRAVSWKAQHIGRYVSISKGPWNAGSRPAAPFF